MTKKAEETVSAEKEALKGFVSDWEEAELIRRKKKLRIARIEKSDEELSFEAGKKFKERGQKKKLKKTEREREREKGRERDGAREMGKDRQTKSESEIESERHRKGKSETR